MPDEPAPSPEPEPTPEPTPPPTPEPEPTVEDSIKEWERRYGIEKRERQKAEQRLAKMEQANATEAEKALAAAREEGRNIALRESGTRLAAAEFRAQATGRLADPTAALEYLDMTRFVDTEGEPDTEAIGAAVDKLVTMAAPPTPAKPLPPRVPNGVQPETPETDWLRAAIRQG